MDQHPDTRRSTFLAIVALLPLLCARDGHADTGLTNALAEGVAQFETAYAAWDGDGLLEARETLARVAEEHGETFLVRYWEELGTRDIVVERSKVLRTVEQGFYYLRVELLSRVRAHLLEGLVQTEWFAIGTSR